MTPALRTSASSTAPALRPVLEESPEEPRAAVAVVHWGSRVHTLACLQSIARSSLVPNPLVVIDNGTGSLRSDDIESVAPRAILVRLPENLGFSGGSNIAIRRALAEGADLVLLLNNDAVLAPDCLAELVRVAQTVPRVAAV